MLKKKNFIIFPSCESGIRNGGVLFMKWKSKYPSISINISVNVFLSTTLDRIHAIATMPPALHRGSSTPSDASLSRWQRLHCSVKTFTAHLPALMALDWLHPAGSLSLLHQWNSHQKPLIFIWLCEHAYVRMTVYMCVGGLLILQKPNLIKGKLRFYVNK